MARMRFMPRHQARAVSLSLAIGAAILLRFTALTAHSLWFDEASTVHLAKSTDVLEALELDRQPPLSILAFRLWIGLFGDSDGTLRVLTALAGIACVVITAAAARILTPSSAAYATALMAVAPFSVWHSLEIRSYAFLELCGAVALLVIAQAHRSGRASRSLVAAAFLTSAIAPGLHYVGFFVPLSLIVGAFILLLQKAVERRDLVRLTVACILGMLLWLPWMLTVFRVQLENPWGYTGNVTMLEVLLLPARLVVTELRFLEGAWLWLASGVALAVLGGFAIHAGLTLARRSPGDAVVATAWFVPMAGLILSSLIGPSNFSPRYFIAASPAVTLAVCRGLRSLGPRLGAGLGVAIVMAAALVTLHINSRNLKEDYRGVVAMVQDAWKDGDIIVSVTGTLPGHSRAPLVHYLGGTEVDGPIVDSTQIGFGAPADRDPSIRLHVVHRIASYATPEMERLANAGDVIHRSDASFRIQYILIEPRRRVVVSPN